MSKDTDSIGNMGKREEVEKFNEWFSENYNRVKQLLQSFCYHTTYNWNDDAFHDMYLAILQSLENGRRLNYRTIDNYIFISYKNQLNKNSALSWNKARDINYNDTNINNIRRYEEDEDEKREDEAKFQKLYNFLCVVEKDVYQNCDESVAAVFSKKFDNQLLDIQNGDRKKFEDAKKYVRQNWTEYYENNIRIKKSEL